LGLEQISLSPREIEKNLAHNKTLSPGAAFFPRIDLELAAKTEETKKKPSPGKEEFLPAEILSFEDFKKVDLKVAEILSAERLPKSDKLLKFRVAIGQEERTIVAGLGKYYSPEEMVGRKVIVVANLAPAKLMGVESQGMILAASLDGDLTILSLDKPLPSGAKVS
jgi:methionyl-tRNA synthetase